MVSSLPASENFVPESFALAKYQNIAKPYGILKFSVDCSELWCQLRLAR
jgi:hypothetical protein